MLTVPNEMGEITEDTAGFVVDFGGSCMVFWSLTMDRIGVQHLRKPDPWKKMKNSAYISLDMFS